jgi:hypothetical protein
MSQIRIERDAVFWSAAGAGEDGRLVALLERASTYPLAAESGGFIFVSRDEVGFIYELHTLFKAEAWGTRDLALAAREAFHFMFDRGMRLCFTYEVDGNWRSQPPKSHGWKVAGDFTETRVGVVCPWFLTEAAWRASPVGRRRG